jgi:hypothetical protein
MIRVQEGDRDMANFYSTGTRVRVRIRGGETITATIERFYSDIKGGRPGYDLRDCSDGVEHWCYADQVREVLS